MSTLHISDGLGAADVSVSQDLGSSIEITNLDAFDLNLLANQKKMGGTPPRSPLPAAAPSGGDDIEFVNLEDTNVTFDVRPPASGASDTIKILRDAAPEPAPMHMNSSGPSLTIHPTPAAPAPAPAASSSGSWFSGLSGLGKPAAPAAPEPSNGGGFASGLKSWFGSGGSASSASAAPAPATESDVYLTPEAEAVKKTELLTLLERMDRKGVGGNKMTVANTLEEVKAELERRKDSKGLEASIRFQRSMLTTVTNGLEFLNSRYDPLGVALDGWSEQVSENVEDYDEIFEELYDKYKDKSKVAPEVRLVMSLGLSAAMCHITNTMFKSRMPGMDDILRKNPDLARQMAQAAAQESVGPGFAKFVSMGGPAPQMRRPTPPQHPSAVMFAEPPEDMPRAFMAPMGSGVGAEIPSRDPRDQPTARREMRGPSNVADILQTLNANNAGPGSVHDDENGSVISGYTTETMRRQGISRRKKNTTQQPTGATLTLNV